MSGIFEEKNRMWRLSTRLRVLALDLLWCKVRNKRKEQCVLSERVKRGMSNLWDSGCLGPIAKESSLRRDPLFFAAVRLEELIR